METYYTYDFSQPSDHQRPSFVYSYNRHNEVNLNIGYIKANYATERVRANLALMAGTYANANLASEPGVLKHILEAFGGIKISKSYNLWVEGGIFPSHIGFESATGKDCWTLTRSIMADNSPYYLSGAKVTYTTENDRWLFGALYINGWQRIQRVASNQTPAFGHQLVFKPNKQLTLNSSSFFGSDTPDSSRCMRYFHNLYAVVQFDKIGCILGFDVGMQQTAKNSSNYYLWYAPILISKYSLTDKFSIAARAEFYSDQNLVIISSPTSKAFETAGASINLDYAFTSQVLWRIEGRGWFSKEPIFQGSVSQNYLLSTALAVWF